MKLPEREKKERYARIIDLGNGNWALDVIEDNVWSDRIEGLSGQIEAFAKAKEMGLSVYSVAKDEGPVL